MFEMMTLLVRSLRTLFRSRADLQIEILALRHQIVVLQRQTPKPKLRPADRRFWVGLSRFWPRWRSALRIVKSSTVIDWHRRGFRWYWAWKIRHGQSKRSTYAPFHGKARWAPRWILLIRIAGSCRPGSSSRFSAANGLKLHSLYISLVLSDAVFCSARSFQAV